MGAFMTISVAEKRQAFIRLHQSGCFALPNPWDLGSLKRLEKLGFSAVASTSAGFAWSLGRTDYKVTLDEKLAHLRQLCAATDLPVNADFENGFSHEPDAVARNVHLAADTGIAGVSVEDWSGSDLYESTLAVARLRAARASLNEHAPDVILVGRCEAMLHGEKEIAPVIERLLAYSAAGADCLYAPGVRRPEHIEAIVRAVTPKPVNVLVMEPEMTVPALAALGVRRVSIGGRLAAAAWQGFDAAAKELADQGSLPVGLFKRA
jgi:2-methylisocitrate lyase-like PEP mutase family enzyme